MSTKKELREAKSEINELRQLLARTFPSGDRKQPHALWKQVRRLSELARDLEYHSDPTPARPAGIANVVNVDQEESVGAGVGGRSAEQPLFPGIRLAPEHVKGDRNLYHSGRPFQQELQRLTKRIESAIDDSAYWVRGLDDTTTSLPSQRRPTCDGCGEIMAIAWKLCPYCGVAREEEG